MQRKIPQKNYIEEAAESSRRIQMVYKIIFKLKPYLIVFIWWHCAVWVVADSYSMVTTDRDQIAHIAHTNPNNARQRVYSHYSIFCAYKIIQAFANVSIFVIIL